MRYRNRGQCSSQSCVSNLATGVGRLCASTSIPALATRAPSALVVHKLFVATAAVLLAFVPSTAFSATNAPSVTDRVTPQAIAKIVPGHSTKADVKALFGAPWRVVQFNDCGEAMDDQADEIWEYRGGDANSPFRLHIEFSENAAVHLIAKIPNNSSGGKGTVAKSAPSSLQGGMSM